MITFLGLGRMGAPMAGRLLAAGHQLIVWNRTAARAEPLAAAGATVAPTPATAVAAADIVITMLADRQALDAVAEQITPAMRSDACLIEMSTVGPSAVQELAKRVPAIVDAPVMGSADRAAAGTLTVLAGGDTSRVKDVLATFGTVVECGGLGAGAARKILLINAGIGTMVLAGELVALAARLGVPDALDILAEGPLPNAVRRARSTGANFPIRLAAKDVGIALDEVSLPVLAEVRKRLVNAPDQEADIRALVG
jgi:3-hydroxyisobutyrate dehydrogenase-like beta-hydroxyacid dehydrogenase